MSILMMSNSLSILCVMGCCTLYGNDTSLPYVDAAGDHRAYVLSAQDQPYSLAKVLPVAQQNPKRSPGVASHHSVLQKTRTLSHAPRRITWGNWEFFNSQPQKFAPYLDGLFVQGNSCSEPCAFIQDDLLSLGAQYIKREAARIGLEYDLTLCFNATTMSPQPRGDKGNFASFTGELWASWYLAKTRDNKHGVFLMVEADWGRGLGFSQNSYSAQKSLGSLIAPQSSYYGGNGVFLSNVSLGLSTWDGKLVFMFGTMDPTNFLDQNAYSADWNGNLINTAFNYNPTLPLLWGNWAYMTAFQPHPNFYTLYYTSGTNTPLNQNPFNYVNENYWAHVAEFGFIFEDVAGIGAGTYRFQYAITEHEHQTGAGAAINVQQQLGKESPLGFFARLGYNDGDAARITGVKAAATAGLVLQAPFSSQGWGSKSNNDQLALGFYWARSGEEEKPYQHKDEYGIELSAVVQITPTWFIQPDVQYIFDPVHAKGRNGAWVFQIQSVWRF